MSDASQIQWYELGIRIAQAAVLFWDPHDDDADIQREEDLALQRMALLLPQIAASQSSNSFVLNRICSQLDWHGDRRQCLTSLSRYLDSAKQLLLVSFTAEQASERDWFRFGGEMVNGDDPYSEGRPDRDRARPFIGAIPHEWQFNDPDTVQALLERLNVRRDHVFPEVPPEDPTRSRFEALPRRLSWAWQRIEVGLRALKNRQTKPSWNFLDKCLRVGDIVVRKYRNSAKNQIALLEAFEQARWAQSIENPITADPSRTVYDLNDGIDPPLIQFHVVDSRPAWKFSVSADDREENL